MISPEEIEIAEQKLMEAMKESSIDSLNELLHEKLVFHIPGGVMITKEMDIANYSSGSMKVSTLDIIGRDVKILDEVAIVSAMVKMEGTYVDDPIDGVYHILRVWKKGNQGWQVIAGSSASSSEL